MSNENSIQETIEPDDTFETLLDDYVTTLRWEGIATQERENIIAYHRGAVSARNARLDIQAARIAELEARQITPEMLEATKIYFQSTDGLEKLMMTNLILLQLKKMGDIK